jgi:RHS repeat-associated protein
VQVQQSNLYDGRGVRVMSVETEESGTIGMDDPPPVNRYYFYTPELEMLNVAAPSTGRTADLIWFGSHPVADHDPSELRYTFTDHLGTPTLQTTPTAAIVWRVEHEPYGKIYTTRTGITDDQPLRFPGQQVAYTTPAGEETYNIFRWYRSGWGRYAQADPIDLDGGINLFAYALGNPWALTDPLGLDTAGCDQFLGKLENPCEKECCAAHDKCSDDNNCTSRSWGDKPNCGGDQTAGCKKCNSDALKCFAGCKPEVRYRHEQEAELLLRQAAQVHQHPKGLPHVRRCNEGMRVRSRARLQNSPFQHAAEEEALVQEGFSLGVVWPSRLCCHQYRVEGAMGLEFFLAGWGLGFTIYLVVQISAIVASRGKSLRIVSAPAPIMIVVLSWTVIAYQRESNLWPIVMIFASPLPAIAVVAIWIALRITKKREAALPRKERSETA